MSDLIDVTDRPKVTGLELHQLIHDRYIKAVRRNELSAKLQTYPDKLHITKDQFETINGGKPTKKNRKYFGPLDHTNTSAYCMEVTVLE